MQRLRLFLLLSTSLWIASPVDAQIDLRKTLEKARQFGKEGQCLLGDKACIEKAQEAGQAVDIVAAKPLNRQGPPETTPGSPGRGQAYYQRLLGIERVRAAQCDPTAPG